MKIVVLTNNNSLFGKKLIQQIEQNNIPLEGVVILNQPISYHLTLLRYVVKRVGFIQAMLLAIMSVIKGFLLTTENISYSDFSSRLYYSNGTNNNDTEDLLKKLKPDILVLGQTGIIRNNIIKTASIGVINSHPGVLPEYRGIDCLKWAILNNDSSKIGCTVHWVNSGVDTGHIITKSLFQIDPKLSLENLEWNLYLLCISKLVSTLKNFQSGIYQEGEKQFANAGKQYYKMSIFNEMKVRNKIKRSHNEPS